MASDKAFDIFYTAYSDQPPVDAYLHIYPNGRAELYVGTYASVPGQLADQVGFFGMALARDTLASLNTFLLQEKFLSRSVGTPPALPFDTVVRGVTLTLGGQHIRLVMANLDKDKALSKLEQMLMDIMREAAKHPLRAAQATLSLTWDGPKLRPELTIANVGTEPLPLVVFDPANEFTNLEVEFTFIQLDQFYPSVTTSRDDIAALVQAGSLPSDVQPLAAGASYQFALPSFAPPSNDPALTVMGTVTLWWPDVGGTNLRRAVVQTASVPLPPATP
jgi:hypothetical protein